MLAIAVAASVSEGAPSAAAAAAAANSAGGANGATTLTPQPTTPHDLPQWALQLLCASTHTALGNPLDTVMCVT